MVDSLNVFESVCLIASDFGRACDLALSWDLEIWLLILDFVPLAKLRQLNEFEFVSSSMVR